MRRSLSMLMLAAVCVVGCKQPTETVPSVTGGDSSSAVTGDAGAVDTSNAAPPAADGASAAPGAAVRFVANTKLEVPGMMCPYGCYPAVEKALVAVPGVQGVQLGEQPEGTPEGVIASKVVELKVADGFNAEAALAALKDAKFEATVVN